jgi:hypothetical protein
MSSISVRLTVVAVCVIMFVVLGAVGRGNLEAQASSVRRTIHAAVTDKAGVALTTLAAGDLQVKDGRVAGEIISVQKASAPMRIAILVADGGRGGYQQGIARFIAKVSGTAEFSLTSVAEQPQLVTNFTGDTTALVTGIKALGQRSGKRTSGQLMESLLDTATKMNREAWRSVILVTRVGGEASTSLRDNVVREELRKHNTLLYVVSPRGADSNDGDAMSLNLVLNDGARESGGRHEQVASTTVVSVLEKMADELNSQFEVVYALPAGTTPSDRVELTTSRKDVVVRAPTRVGN